jgi:transcriptional regulator with XRE-family HTH domain
VYGGGAELNNSSTDGKPRRTAKAANSSCIFVGNAASAHAGVVLPLTTTWLDGETSANAMMTARLDLPNARASWEAQKTAAFLGVSFDSIASIVERNKRSAHLMQLKSVSESTHSERLRKLRLHRQLTWKQLAELLGLTVSMLYQVNRGDRGLSDKALYRLEQAEIAAGLRPPASHEPSFSKPENPDLEIGLNRLRIKLSALDSKSQARVLRAILQIVEGVQRRK